MKNHSEKSNGKEHFWSSPHLRGGGFFPDLQYSFHSNFLSSTTIVITIIGAAFIAVIIVYLAITDF
jgi:hypothetical protein